MTFCNHLQWLKDDFLQYLKDWEVSAQGQPGVKEADRNRTLLSQETLEGLRMTGMHQIYNTAIRT